MSDIVLATGLDRPGFIEASAGTGKTYALAGLFARAVIERRLRVPQILAVTYTIAATAELHARVRSRLRRAAELAALWRDGDPARVAGDRAEVALLRGLLHAALHDGSGEALPALRLRLARAVRDMDLAAITTIHGFCLRVLREHALDAGQALTAVTLQPDNRASRRALAVELWREFAMDAAGSDFLRREFGDIDGLAKQIVPLLAPEPLLPAPPATLPDAAAAQVQAAWQALRAAFADDGARALADVRAAIDGGVLKGNEYKHDQLDALWTWLRTATADAQPPATLHGKFHKYAPDTLRKGIYAAKAKAGATLQSRLFDAIATMLAAHVQHIEWRDALDLQLMHRLRSRAQERDRARKQAFNVRGFDDLVGDVSAALEDPQTRATLATALREQFPLVLVDEFQDTDARQWASFRDLFGDAGLVLVGDPKQAIYGFRGGDVHTYLQARDQVGDTRALDRNHRSRPCVVAATNALFAAMPRDAMGAGIDFAPITPAREGHDADYLLDGRPGPALAFHEVPPGDDGDHDAATSMALAATLCARAIRDRLQAAGDGRAERIGKHGLRRIEPRDCAVLVRRNREAAAVRDALAALGVPAVATGAQSLFASAAAQELLTLLLALAAPGDERRLRAMLATPLFGYDAARLCALAVDGDELRRWQLQCEAWRRQWEQHGPQAMLADATAGCATDVLRHDGGERRLTHLLQLGELMQEARTTHLGVHGQVDWLRAAIDRADDADEAQWPRLESDSGRVQILTLHKSKGLEFPLVFLPFVGIGSGGGGGDFISYHGADGVRVRQWNTGHAAVAGGLDWKSAKACAEREDDEEAMRLLYVGLTRAVDALWVCGGALYGNRKSALHRLLGASTPAQPLRDRLAGQLQWHAGLPDATDATRLQLHDATATPPARVPRRRLQRDWWIHSFSQLHRQRPHGTRALVEDTPAGDERPLAADFDSTTTDSTTIDGARSDDARVDGTAATSVRDLRFSGERFGNTLHHALEHADFAAWRDHAGDAPPGGQDGVLLRALQSQDYREADHADGVRALVPLLAATLNAPLPGADGNAGFRLCDIAPAQRIAELEFHFTLADASAAALLSLLHAHGIALGRRDFGLWPRLSGLMTGKIDLTCRVDGRVYVLDYKSNYLPDYAADTLQQAMAASEYDLQALLYTVAVHRWLRLRLGDGYDFDTHVGGVRYLFCRGLERDAAPEESVSVNGGQRGVVVPPLSRALVEAVDALLAPQGGHADGGHAHEEHADGAHARGGQA